MKNIIKALLIVMVLVLAVATFAACERECTHAGGAATCTEAAVCEICGESYGEPAGHKNANTEPVEPTYTTTGLTSKSYCSVCGEVFKEAEEVPMLVAGMPEIAVVPVENEDLSVALNFQIKDLEELVKDEAYIEALFAKYGTCLVDYALTIEGLTDTEVVFNANATADGCLGGQYDAFGEGWVYVPFEDVKVANNDTFYIMQYASELMNEPGLRFTFAEVAEVVGSFNCGIYFTPEFLADNSDMVVKLELHVFTEDEAGVKTLVEGGVVATAEYVVVEGVLVANTAE